MASLVERITNLSTGIGNYIRDSVLPRLVPAGGTTGQVLAKRTGTNYDLSWITGGNVTGPASSAAGNLSAFGGTGGTSIVDSGFAPSSFALVDDPFLNALIYGGSGATSTTSTSSGGSSSARNVTGPQSATATNVAAFADASGLTIQDTGIPLQNISLSYPTLAAAVAAKIPSTATTVNLAGYYAAGDGGQDALYRRVAAAPTAHTWFFTDANGGYWEFCGDTPNAHQAGAKGDWDVTSQTGADDTAALQRAFSYLLSPAVFNRSNVGNFVATRPGYRKVTAIRRAKLRLRPGVYKHTGNLATPGKNNQAPLLLVEGEDRASVALVNTADTYVFPAGDTIGLKMTGIAFYGGRGVFVSDYAQIMVDLYYEISDCSFYDHTGTAIGANSFDNPFWVIKRNIFAPSQSNFANGLDVSQTTGVCIALNGLCDQHDISNNTFIYYRGALKLEAGNNVLIDNNFFGGSCVTGGYDVWLTPRLSVANDPNIGWGCLSTKNKYSIEGRISDTYMVLCAKETYPSTGSYWEGARAYSYVTTGDDNITYAIGGFRSTDDSFFIGGYAIKHAPFHSFVRLGGWVIQHPQIKGDAVPYVVEQAAGSPGKSGDIIRSNLLVMGGSPDANSRGGTGTNYPRFSRPVSAIFNWMVVDQNVNFPGMIGSPMAYGGTDDPGYFQRNDIPIANGTMASGSTPAAVTGPWGFTSARELVFTSATDSWTSPVIARHLNGQNGWIEFDIKASSTNPLEFISFFLLLGGNLILKSWTPKCNGVWQTIRLPFTDSDNSGNVQIIIQPQDWLSGARTQVQVNRIRTYESNQPINYGHARSGGSAWDRPHFVMGSYHLWIDDTNRLLLKNGVPTSIYDGTVVGSQS